MIETQGRVIRLDGDLAEVQVGVSSGCSLCDSGRGCGAGIFARLLGRKSASVEVSNTIEAIPGQSVRLGIPERVFLLFVARLYLMPLAASLAGATIGHHLAVSMHAGAGMTDAGSFLGAMVSFVFVLYLCRQRGRDLPRRLDIELNRVPGWQGDGTECQKSCQLNES